MAVRLDASMGSLVLGTWADLGESSREDWALPSPASLGLAIAEQPGAAAALRTLLHELGEPGLEFADAHELAERVFALVERGRLRVVAEHARILATVPVERGEPATPSEPEPTPQTQLHWVEIMIVGEDDEGIGGIRCEITLPDGRKRDATTNRDGLIRIDGITDAGDCTIRFPDIDREALEPA
jgi:hypothetical protein